MGLIEILILGGLAALLILVLLPVLLFTFLLKGRSGREALKSDDLDTLREIDGELDRLDERIRNLEIILVGRSARERERRHDETPR